MAIALIVAVAIATRIVGWWNPVAHVDDQFYLLAGEELLKGHWPYIDVWDRKPLGLFLLYAGIAWIGGGTILGLNLVATAFAASTAIVVRQIALRFASPLAALLAALTYLFVLPLYGGQNGQSPVFYNLLIAGAVLLLFRASEAPEWPNRHPIRLRRHAALRPCHDDQADQLRRGHLRRPRLPLAASPDRNAACWRLPEPDWQWSQSRSPRPP